MGSSANTAARKALALLLVINLFNYIDRQMLAAVVPKIEAEFHKSKGELGLLLSMFLISYTVAAPIFGWLGDRYSRWKLIAVGVILWSLASGGTGLATTFGILHVDACAYRRRRSSLWAGRAELDLRSLSRRSSRRSIGVVLHGYPGRSARSATCSAGRCPTRPSAGAGHFTWSFLPACCSEFSCLLMPEPNPERADAGEHRVPTLRDTKILFRIPSYVLNTLGMTAMTFSLGAIAAWMPTYLVRTRRNVHADAGRDRQSANTGTRIGPRARRNT